MNTVSLDLAKKLHAIGYRGETEKVYAFMGEHENDFDLTLREDLTQVRPTDYSAPNATEIFSQLPNGTRVTKGLASGLYLSYLHDEFDFKTPPNERWADTPSEALGLLMLSLHEKGIIK